METKRMRFFLAASPIWAWIETGFIGLLAMWGLAIGYQRIEDRLLGQLFLFLMPLLALWYSLRLRTPSNASNDRRLWRRIAYEILTALALSPLASGIWLLILQRLGLYDTVSRNVLGPAGLVLVLASLGPLVLVFRAGIHAWLYWMHLRRRRLVWALTHIQLQFVLVLVALAAIAAAVALVWPSEGGIFNLDTWVFTLLPFLGIAGVATLIGLVGIIPPALLFAWLAARRTNRRLESLTRATAALREGDYDIRVPVEGEDEIAQLQGDFNAMAASLEYAMQELQDERDKVTSLLDARRQLVAGVSHELRTPLATVRGYLESAQQTLTAKADADAASLYRDLAVMEQELVRLQGLIDDLFTLSRAEVDGLTLKIEPVDVETVVTRRVQAIAPLAWERDRVQIVSEVSDGLHPASVDESRLEQIIINLLRNAVRHTPPGGIIAISAEPHADEVCIKVCDTGEGIPPEDLPHIWDRFYRGEHARTQDASGAGLGLALVKELTDAMGGCVDVESKVGTGSCFSVYLPSAAN